MIKFIAAERLNAEKYAVRVKRYIIIVPAEGNLNDAPRIYILHKH